jgi:PAS domain S-box-containing protein
MSWRPSSASVLLLAGAVAFALAIAYVWRRRASSAGSGLLLLLLASAVWSVAYALELSGADLATRQLWGDLKYLGLCLLPPAFLIFVLQYTGVARRFDWRALALLAAEPLAVLLLLANGATHDLIRYYPPGATVESHPVAANGPLFWPNAIYAYALVWIAMGLFLVRLGRVSGAYRRQSAFLFASLLPPFAANLLFVLDVGPFGRVELTPFLLLLTFSVVIWGLFRFRLLDLLPVGRSRIVATIGDGVLVLDHLRRVIDVNPAAERLLGRTGGGAIGQPFDRLLPGWAQLVAEQSGTARTTEAELAGRSYELLISPLPDRRGRPVGQLIAARDITDRKWAEEDLRATLERLRAVDEQRRHLLARLVDAQRSERHRFAGSLNSEALQSVSTALVRLRVLSRSLQAEERERWLQEVALPLTTGLDQLRGVLSELRQPVIDRSGLAAALDEYAEAIRATGAEVGIESHVGRELPEETRAAAFRIAQEALTNVRAHALASMVTITVEESGEGLLVRIEDNGVGFTPDNLSGAGRTPGLGSMRERAEASGGWLRIESAPGEGATIQYWLPT